jgi:hypothetical protein
MAEYFKVLGEYKTQDHDYNPKRLDTVEEYYFSSKLREVRQLQSEGKPITHSVQI